MFDGDELLARFVALEKEAMADVSAVLYPDVDAFPRWFAVSERMPYWANTIGVIAPDENDGGYGEEASLYNIAVHSKLVFAHVTAGQVGEVDDSLNAAIPQIIEYFNQRRQLQSQSPLLDYDYDAPMAWLEAPGISLVRAVFVPQMSPTVSGGIPTGYEFQWRCPFLVGVEQTYLG